RKWPPTLPRPPSLTATLRAVPMGGVGEGRRDSRVVPPPGRLRGCRKNRDGLTGRFFGGRVRCRTACGAFRYRQEDEIVTLRTPFRLAAGAGLWLAAAAVAEPPTHPDAVPSANAAVINPADQQLADAVARRLAESGKLRGANVDIACQNGVVALAG